MSAEIAPLDLTAFDYANPLVGLDDIRAVNPQRYEFEILSGIVHVDPPKGVIVGFKDLALDEFWTRGHMPGYPVLPGVLMIEALVQASAWVVRTALDFRPSVIVLKDARNVTYKSFLAPGRVMRIECECKELNEQESTFAARGEVDGREIVKGKLVLRHLCLADHNPQMGATDERLRGRLRGLYELLTLASAG